MKLNEYSKEYIATIKGKVGLLGVYRAFSTEFKVPQLFYPIYPGFCEFLYLDLCFSRIAFRSPSLILHRVAVSTQQVLHKCSENDFGKVKVWLVVVSAMNALWFDFGRCGCVNHLTESSLV